VPTEAGWEGEPENRKARRPAVFEDSAMMVKLPFLGTRIPNLLKVQESWVQALSPFLRTQGFLFLQV